ncbi:MAG: radical SAM protein, partial [Acidimicrobiales bacterium]
MPDLRFAWLELTGRCSLLCDHCYADSGPKGTDGAMLPEDWLRAIDELAQLSGRMVQFIGGEPTLHRSLPTFVDHALIGGLGVEVFSNLVHVSPKLWEVFAQPGVRLATSYYSDNATEHDVITKGKNSYARTRANIIEALRRSIPLRVGLIDVQDGQRVEQARAELEAFGVTEIGPDRLRQIGRGVRDQQSSVDQL